MGRTGEVGSWCHASHCNGQKWGIATRGLHQTKNQDPLNYLHPCAKPKSQVAGTDLPQSHKLDLERHFFRGTFLLSFTQPYFAHLLSRHPPPPLQHTNDLGCRSHHDARNQNYVICCLTGTYVLYDPFFLFMVACCLYIASQ